MAFTTDVETDIGKVRLLLHDLDESKPLFPEDSYIQVFLDLESDDVKCAAALGLETIAGNRVLTMQVIQLLDLKMDGRQVAEALLKTAQRLRDSSNDEFSFDIAQQADLTVFGYQEYLLKQQEAE